MYINPRYVDSTSYIYLPAIPAVDISIFDYSAINISWIHSPSIQRICSLNTFRSDVANHPGDTFRQTLHPMSHPLDDSRGQKHRNYDSFRGRARAGGDRKARGENGGSRGLVMWHTSHPCEWPSGARPPNNRYMRSKWPPRTPPTPLHVSLCPVPRIPPLTHPPSPRLPAVAPEPFLSATGLSPPSSSLHPSHVCPRSSLTSEPSHWLPTSQYYPCRPRGCSFSLSLAHSWIYSPFRLSPSFLYLPLIFVYIFHFSRCSSSFFPSDICSIRLQLGRARSLPSKMTPSQIDKARKIYCRAQSVATFAQVPCANRDKEQRRRPGRNPILEGANFDSLSSRSILNLKMTR